MLKNLVGATALVSMFSLFSFSAQADPAYTIKDGQLERPTGYREWVYVGTPVTPNDMNNGKAAFPEHHNVYIDPASWDYWKKTGKFRDGTILVKELVSNGSKVAVSGNGYFQGEYIGLEATIKSKTDFPNEPGNWAYFTFSTPDHKSLTETAKAFPAASCNSCHKAAAADDFVFTQYYPVLSAGKGKGKIASGGFESKLSNSYKN
ncbi:cytochrome P460 family protein [Gayadomonas joobiniege]|uniref:cytochrome P460 family protein n=1 Tax=Gayadomonas joobiniege TaxID=1234606 RepID=UPI000375F8F5|nr:cytochrome P460 family protein [Gayadomonas joobiniege]